MKLKQTILASTKPMRSTNEFQTTSFTLLKSEYKSFKLACKKANRVPSDVLRQLAILFVNELKGKK